MRLIRRFLHIFAFSVWKHVFENLISTDFSSFSVENASSRTVFYNSEISPKKKGRLT